MNLKILIVLLGTLLAFALGYALLQPASEAAAPDRGLTASPTASPDPSASASLAGETKRPATEDIAPLATAESEWAQASLSHQEAERALKESERALNEVERDVEAVERFIVDLEERGDDPADFAEEGMAKLGPAIEQFEARLELVERNERLEEEARTRLDLAEAELARQRSVSP